MYEIKVGKLVEDERRREQRFQTLIPGLVTVENLPSLTDKPVGGQNGLTLRGFQGVVRNLSQNGLMFDADASGERVIKKAIGELFVTIGTAHNWNRLSLPALVVWVKNYESKDEGRRCLVGLGYIPNHEQIIQVGAIVSEIRNGRIFYKEFSIERTVYFGDTNVEGNVYFVRFFEWQGIAREEFYLRIMPDAVGFLKSGTRIITVEAKIQFKSQFVLFDRVTIEVTVKAIRTANIELLFLYRKKGTGELAAIGTQRLAFTNEEGFIIPVPLEVTASLKPYLNPYKDLKTYL